MGYKSLAINGREIKNLSLNGRQIWKKSGKDYSVPFTIVSGADNNTITFQRYPTEYASNVQITYFKYSTNGQNWIDFDTTNPFSITLNNAGDSVMIKAQDVNDKLFGDSATGHTWISSTQSMSLKGNIMSLLYNEFEDKFTFNAVNAFKRVFLQTTTLTDASQLLLPATTLIDSCYDSMFSGCKALTTAPELPATTLATECYYNMFYGCTSLTTSPELPATTLVSYCYSYMFKNCTALTKAPELPATTLVSYCYRQMFYGCTKLTSAPTLPSTTLATYCYYQMFYGCTALITTSTILPATTLANNCYREMFSGCSSLTSAPEIMATNINFATSLRQMFYNCSNLNYIKVHFTSWPSTVRTTNWVSGVSSTGTFVCPSALPQTTGNNYIPATWTIETY